MSPSLTDSAKGGDLTVLSSSPEVIERNIKDVLPLVYHLAHMYATVDHIKDVLPLVYHLAHMYATVDQIVFSNRTALIK